jgi:hypothetical protein
MLPIEAISEMLGHSDITTTLRVYAHVLPSAHAQAAKRGYACSSMTKPRSSIISRASSLR